MLGTYYRQHAMREEYRASSPNAIRRCFRKRETTVPFDPLNLHCTLARRRRDGQLGWRDIGRAESLARISEKGMHSRVFVATRAAAQLYALGTLRFLLRFERIYFMR